MAGSPPVKEHPQAASSSSSPTGPPPAGPSTPSTTSSSNPPIQQEKHKGGYPGQITGGKRANRTEEGDDEDDSLPEDEPLDLGPLSPRSLYALRNLARYGRRQRSVPLGSKNEDVPWERYYPDWPKERRAGVMVALFGGKTGELNVGLSTRALDLRVNVCLVPHHKVFHLKLTELVLLIFNSPAKSHCPVARWRREICLWNIQLAVRHTKR